VGFATQQPRRWAKAPTPQTATGQDAARKSDLAGLL
jgi:hypothetical protein